MGQYDDILYTDYQGPTRHEHMSPSKRAGQFAPFAALRGFGDEIRETGRYTDGRTELDESRREELDRVLQDALKGETGKITVTYFQPDERKSGGTYLRITGILSGTDEIRRELIFRDGTVLPVDRIYDIVPAEE